MATQEQSVACTLEESELVERVEAWQQVVSHATGQEVEDDRVVTTYPQDARLLDRLRELIAAEAECCPFLEFSVDERRDSIVTELRFAEGTPASMRDMVLGLSAD
jgi:hypothetical protein